MNSSCNTAAKIVDSAVAHFGTVDVVHSDAKPIARYTRLGDFEQRVAYR